MFEQPANKKEKGDRRQSAVPKNQRSEAFHNVEIEPITHNIRSLHSIALTAMCVKEMQPRKGLQTVAKDFIRLLKC